MNAFSTKKYLILVAVSLAFSLVIIRGHSVSNVSFCINVAGCRDQGLRGTVSERIYGFPLTYKKVSTFRPVQTGENIPKDARSAETSIENQAFSVPSVLMNALFWFGLLQLAARFVKPRNIARTNDLPQEQVLQNSLR